MVREPREREAEPHRGQDELRRLREEIDRDVARLQERHADRLVCGRGCADCCADDLAVFDVEAESIRRQHGALLAGGTPHPEGRCAFLGDEDECRIYDSRPYVCRTQGLPLRWMDASRQAEMRDICPLNEEGTPLTRLPTADCWTLGPVEERLRRIQRVHGGGGMQRVRLRSLFAAGGSEAGG